MTDVDKSIVELAKSLGEDLADTEEFKQKQESEEVLRQNEEARKLVKEFKNLKNSFERMERLGAALTDKNRQQLKDAEEKAMQHPMVKEWYEKSQNFYDLVIKVNEKMQEMMINSTKK
ncbi:MAG: YlbF family regulator [Firmicutes bacterium]|nr:YlbF family regulator [Bacillota bacterium]